MKCLIVIDVQNGFVSENTQMIVPRLEKLMDEFKGELIIATQFINTEKSGFTDIIHWNRLKEKPEIDVLPFVSGKASFVATKSTYSACTDQVMNAIQENGISEVYLAGIDTDCCVLTTAIALFEHNIRPIVLEHYCASNGGSKSHLAALNVLGRTIGRQQIIEGTFP